MSLICVGASHRSADVPVLERLTIPASEVSGLIAALLERPNVSEALVLSTCNRVEIYARVGSFHGGLADLTEVLAERVAGTVADLASSLYVRYEAEVVRHLFRVAAGLDSMVVGEPQILGQLRAAYQAAIEHSGAGRTLHELVQQALRVGKRAQSETGIERAGFSVVDAALTLGEAETGPLAGRSALVIGAGAMGVLALASLRRAGAAPLTVANRSLDRAGHAAAANGARVTPLGQVGALLGEVDIVVAATAAAEPLLLAPDLVAARPDGRALLVLDLALPRNAGPGVADVPGVTLIDIARLDQANRPDRSAAAAGPDGVSLDPPVPDPVNEAVRAAETIVAAEVDSFLNWLRGAAVAPTVAALRARAGQVVAGELERLAQRRVDLSADQQAEVARTVHRVVARLLHEPSVRVRELAAGPDGRSYARVLRELFDLEVAEVPEGTEDIW